MSNTRYNFSSTQINQINAKLLYVTSAKYGTDWHSTLHAHHFTELFYVIGGIGSFLVNEKSFPVHPHDLIIINSYIDHTEISFSQNPLEYIALGVEGLSFSAGETENDTSYTLNNFQDYQNEILLYMQTLLLEIEKKELDYEIVCQNLLEVLVVNIIRHTRYALSVNSSHRLSKECAHIKHYIDENYTKNITLDFIASETHMNKYYLVHAFNKYMGTSPINYLIERRIEESKNLLESTNYSILQISEIIGFSSQSYFSQSFKKSMGMTPNQYRKIYKSS